MILLGGWFWVRCCLIVVVDLGCFLVLLLLGCLLVGWIWVCVLLWFVRFAGWV